jgi:hypothetical protein
VLRTSPPPHCAGPFVAGVWLIIPDLAVWGFPRRVRLPCTHPAGTNPVQRLGVVLAHLAKPYQPSPITLSGRPAHRAFRGLLSARSRCDPHTGAVTNIRDLPYPRFQPFYHVDDCSGCFRLEAVARWGWPPHCEAPYHRAHGKQSLRIVAVEVAVGDEAIIRLGKVCEPFITPNPATPSRVRLGQATNHGYRLAASDWS